MLVFQLTTSRPLVGLPLYTLSAPISQCFPVGGSDYSALRDQQFTFSAGLLELSIAVDIIDDFLYEHDEIFLVKMELISEPFPGLTIDKDNVSITIIDNDGRFIINVYCWSHDIRPTRYF